MKKLIYTVNALSLLLITLLMIKCEGYDNRQIIFENNSMNSVYYSMTIEDQMFNIEKYRIKQRLKKGEELSSIDITGLFMSGEIIKDSITEISRRPREWKRYINSAKDKKLHFYVIVKDSVDKYGWERIHASNIYNKKYTLDIDDLDSLNWTIEYSGN
ncbi:hypothetical protein MG290_08395 [Flavobacterium sp. CBA20B-1]|uniref:hypothetical protein n=1 Tax=unclassified Flavobacterium TaxID=196869 RepID=UPI002224BC7E|nr:MULTISPECIES: hypothetical protein [unclassified Flavobacterium]WCM40981.1 hypothetical protein MG290_08395 [Flavobacterium sp. CBA20B-1]